MSPLPSPSCREFGVARQLAPRGPALDIRPRLALLGPANDCGPSSPPPESESTGLDDEGPVSSSRATGPRAAHPADDRAPVSRARISGVSEADRELAAALTEDFLRRLANGDFED
jgi:hypothetical protein